MSEIQDRIDRAEVWGDWYADMLENFVEEAALKGINIPVEQNKRGRNEPAISFAGFWSQGDGLAFDCNINWPVFLEANPSFKENRLNWYLLLVANPSYVNAGTSRHGRNGNSMTANSDIDWIPDAVVEDGFFAGVPTDQIENDPTFLGIDSEVLSICEDEAGRMYKALEAEYEHHLEFERQTIREEIIDGLRGELKLILTELAKCEVFRKQYMHDDVEWGNLDALGLVEHSRGGYWYVTDAGWEVIECQTT